MWQGNGKHTKALLRSIVVYLADALHGARMKMCRVQTRTARRREACCVASAMIYRKSSSVRQQGQVHRTRETSEEEGEWQSKETAAELVAEPCSSLRIHEALEIGEGIAGKHGHVQQLLKV